MEALVAIGSTLINISILIAISRRVLGVPIGWGRAAVISGLMVLGVDAVIDPVLEFLRVGPNTPPVPLILVLALLVGCALALQLVILTVLELVIPTRSMPSIRVILFGVPGAWRRMRRQAAIWWIIMRRGLTIHLGPDRAVTSDSSRIARSLRTALTDAGVTFVKFGQMLATRTDVIGTPFVHELSKLHSQVAAEPWEKVRPVIESELPARLEEIFATLDETPLAAASVAQIHAATLTDGQQVVIKVRRPRARAQVTADLSVIDAGRRRELADELFAAMMDVVVRHGFRVPPQLAALFRTMGSLDGTSGLLDPRYDLVTALRDQTEILAEGLIGRHAVREQIEHQLAKVLPLLARMPRRLSRITEQLENGTFALTTRPLAHADDRR